MEYRGPDHLSVSQVHAIRENSWHWFLERVARLPRRPAWALVGGKALHAATEEIDKEDNLSLDYDAAAFLFRRHLDAQVAEEVDRADDQFKDPDTWRASGRVSKEWPLKENLTWWSVNGPAMVMNWVTWRINNPAWEIATIGGVPAIEAEISGPLGKSMDLLGFIDRVMFNAATGAFMVLDLKSGVRTPGDNMQLGTYSLFLDQLFGIRPQWGTYWMARQGTTTPPVDLIQEWPAARLEHDLLAAEAVVRGNALSCSQNQFAASSSVAQFCYACNPTESGLLVPWEVQVVLPERTATPWC